MRPITTLWDIDRGDIMKKFVYRKYMGDDCYSWAVFRKDDIPKGHRGIVCDYDIQPVVNGLSRDSARSIAESLNLK